MRQPYEDSEAFVKSRLTTFLKKYGIYYIKPVSQFNRGIPDFIVCIDSYFIAIECKSKRGALTEHQKQHQQRIAQSRGAFIIARPETLSETKDYLLTCIAQTRPENLVTKKMN